MKTFVAVTLLAALAPTLLTGCRARTSLPGAGGFDPMPAFVPLPAPAADPAPMPKVPFEITMQSTQKDDAPIELSIEIKNVTAQTIELNFTSGQKFDFSATPAGATDAVWSYGMNKRFIQSLSTVALEPGKPLHFETTWKDAKPGKYTIRAVIKANGGMESTPFEIEVN